MRRFLAADDRGNIINPVIVEGQIHGGVTQGLGPALYQGIPYDEDGKNLAGSFMDYLVPAAVETPAWETARTVTPSPHHPLGAEGVGSSVTLGSLTRAASDSIRIGTETADKRYRGGGNGQRA